MNKKFYALFGILILVFVAIPTFASHTWANYHWARSSNPLELTYGDNMDSTWDGHLLAAVADWNASPVLNLTRVGPASNVRRCTSKASNHVEICNARYGNTGWLGIAGISISGDHITSGYAKMNDTYFDTASYDTPEWRQMVVCQEIGHLFGLGHQDEGFDNPNLGTCMDYTSDPARDDGLGDNQNPDAHDYDLLNTIYGHLDGTANTANNGASAAAGNNGIQGGDSPSDWGQLVRQNGRIAVYERDFGNGNSELTIVIWAN